MHVIKDVDKKLQNQKRLEFYHQSVFRHFMSCRTGMMSRDIERLARLYVVGRLDAYGVVSSVGMI